jgi:hypothetical protein
MISIIEKVKAAQDRIKCIPVGDGASMIIPLNAWLWELRYANEPKRERTIADDRMLAASALDSYMYLIQECTRDEAWRRIKILREALRKEHEIAELCAAPEPSA